MGDPRTVGIDVYRDGGCRMGEPRMKAEASMG
jgi:hypothetical protein